MDFMVVVILEPGPKGLIEVIEGDTVLDPGEEAIPDGSEKAFHLPAGRAVIGFGVDEGDPGLGTASSQKIRGETRTVIDVKPLGDSVSQEGLLEDDGQGADRFGGAEGMTDHHAGVVIEDGAEDGFGRAIGGADLGAMHEIGDPEIVDVIHFVGLAYIGPILEREPSLLFNHPEQGVVVNGRLSQQILIPKHFIKFLHGQGGIGLAFDLNGFEQILCEAFGSPPIGAVFGFEQIKAPFAILPEPGLHRGNSDLPEAVAGELMLDIGLFPEVFVLSPGGFGQNGADELIAFEGDFFSNLFVHGLVLLCEFFDHRSTMTMKPMINPYKHRPLARLCTIALRILSPESPRKVSQSKGEDCGRITTGGF